MPDQEVVIVGADGTEHVFPAGFDPKKAAAIVSKAGPAAAPGEKEPDTWMGGAVKGLREGVAGGAKGFVQGMAESPVNLVSGIGTMLTQPVTKTVGDTFDAIGRIPAAVRGAGADPEGWGRDVGNLTGQTMLTAAAPKVLPAAARVAVRASAAVNPELIAKLVKHGSTAAGAAMAGPAGAIVGGGIGEELAARIRARIPKGATAPPTEAIVEELRKAPPEPFEPVLTPGEPPPAGAVTPKQLNEARLAEIRAAYRAKQAPPVSSAQPAVAAVPPEAPAPNDALAARMGTIRNTPSAGGATHYPGDPSLGPAGPNMHDVAARTVDAYQMPSRATEARAQWHPVPASPEQAAAAATALEPVPLSKAVTAVRQAATAVKQKLTATEFTEATRLAKAGHPADSVLEAIQVQRALKGQSSFAGLPTDAEMRADMGRRAVGGQKSLMATYGPKVSAFMKEDAGSARLSTDVPLAEKSASDLTRDMADLRDTKPRPLDKLYGTNGPTPAQADQHAQQMRDWNRQYREVSKQQKIALERDNARMSNPFR